MNQEDIFQKSPEYFANENKILKNQITYFQNTLASLQAENFSNLQTVKNLTQENSAFQSQFVQQNDKIQTLQKSIEDLEKEIREKETKILELNHTIHLSTDAIAASSNFKKEFKDQIAALTAELEKKSNELVITQTKLSKISLQKQELEAKLGQISKELLDERLNRVEEEKELKQKITQLEESGEISKIQKEALNKSKDKFINEISILKNQLLEEKERYDDKLNSLNNELSELQKKLKESEVTIEKKDYNIHLQALKLEELNNSFQQNNKALIQMRNENSFLRQVINDKENENKDLHEIKRKFDTKNMYNSFINNTISYGEFESLQQELQKIKSSVYNLKKEKEVLESNNKNLLNKLKDYVDMKEKFSVLSKENEELKQIKKKFDDLTKKFNEVDDLKENYKKTITILNLQNRKLLFEVTSKEAMNSFDFQNMDKDQYASFIYSNIDTLQLVNNDNIKKFLAMEKEEKDLREKLIKQEKENKEIKELVIQMEAYTKEIEEINKTQQEEIDKFKSGYSLDPNLLSLAGENELINNFVNKYNQLLEKEQNVSLSLKLLQEKYEKEVEKNSFLSQERKAQQEENSKLGREIIDLKTKLVQTDSESKQISSELERAQKSVKIIQAQLTEAQNMNRTLANDKLTLNNLFNDMLRKNNEKIEKTHQTFENNMKEMKEENLDIKTNLNAIKTLIDKIDKEKLDKINQDIELVSSVSKSNAKDLSNNKAEELLESRKEIEKLKITLDNVSTENSMLKYKLSLFSSKLNEKSSLRKSEIISNSIRISAVEKGEEEEKDVEMAGLNESLEKKYLDSTKKLQEVLDENNALKKEVEFLKDSNAKFLNQDISAPYSYLMKQLEEISQEKAELVVEKGNLVKEKEDIIKNYSHINLTNEGLKAKISSLEKLNAASSKEIISLNEQIKSLNAQIEDFKKKDIDNSNKKIEELKQQVESMEEEKKLMEANEKNLKEEIEKSKREAHEAKKKSFNNFYVAFIKSKKIIPYLSGINKSLEEQLEEFEKVKEKYDDKISALELGKTAQEEKLKQKEERISSLENELLVYKTKVESLNKELTLITPEKEQTEQVNVNLKSGYNTMFKCFRKTQNIYNFLQSKLSEVEKDKQVLSEEIQKLKSTISEKEKVNKELEEEIEKRNAIIKETKNENLKLAMKDEFISKEVNSIGEYFKNQSPQTKKVDYEKTKSFSKLILQMRTAVKLIHYLMNKAK